jgi:hypothetical protein
MRGDSLDPRIARLSRTVLLAWLIDSPIWLRKCLKGVGDSLILGRDLGPGRQILCTLWSSPETNVVQVAGVLAGLVLAPGPRN